MEQAQQKQGTFIIYVSDNGQDDWKVVAPEDVPEWLKHPDVMGELAVGNMAQNKGLVAVEGVVYPWYRAEQVKSPDDATRILKARVKRARKNARRISVVH